MKKLIRATICIIAILSTGHAYAAYSPPLTNVRIDQDYSRHTPSIVIANIQREVGSSNIELYAVGAQYLVQWERNYGFGVQFGVGMGTATVEAFLPTQTNALLKTDTNGFWFGGQLRAYQMLWKSKTEEGQRPSALTAFVNLRALYYQTQGANDEGTILLDSKLLTGGLGAMAEISLGKFFSFAPYVWVTPEIYNQVDYSIGNYVAQRTSGVTLRRPLLFGADLWFYPTPPNWNNKITFSVLASLLDTEGEDQSVIGVFGYTF